MLNKSLGCPLIATHVAFICAYLLVLTSHVSQANQVTDELLITHLKELSSPKFAGRKPGTQGHLLAQKYLQAALQHSHNLDQSGSQTFNFYKGLTKQEGRNIYFIKKGTRNPNKFIVITAHYDHLGKHRGKIFPGADDNASGTSVLLTIKHWLSSQTMKHSIILLATDAEEDGLHGAKAFLNNNIVPIDSIVLNINLDMLAYGVKQKYLIVSGLKRNPQFLPLVKASNLNNTIPFKAKEYLQLKNNSISKQRLNLHVTSDHYAFYQASVPYLFITGENHRYYHTPLDSFEKIDQIFFINAYETIRNLLQVIDNEI